MFSGPKPEVSSKSSVAVGPVGEAKYTCVPAGSIICKSISAVVFQVKVARSAPLPSELVSGTALYNPTGPPPRLAATCPVNDCATVSVSSTRVWGDARRIR